MDCVLCERQRVEGSVFCASHFKALTNIRNRYWEWDKAYGGLSKREYLKMLGERKESGRLVLEIVRFLLEKEMLDHV